MSPRRKAAAALLIFFFFLSACSHGKTKHALKAAEPPKPARAAVAEPAPPTPPQPPTIPEKTLLVSGPELRQFISQWISQHESASYGEAAAAANQILRRFGYPVVFDAAERIAPGDRFLILKSGRKLFAVQRGSDLGAEACGEQFVKIPSLGFKKGSAKLVYEGESFPYSTEGLRRDVFHLFRGKKLINTIESPEPTEPVGISKDGSAVFLLFPLDEKLAGLWFSKIARSHPELYGEDPYLVLRVTKYSISFEKNERFLDPQEYDTLESGGDKILWRFQPSGITLELSTKCGPQR